MLVLISLVQYIAVVVAFSIGKPFRKPMYTNLPFTITVLLLTVLSYYVMLTPDTFTKEQIFDVAYLLSL
jgi:cation-transporting ATPase 13A2